MGLLSMRPDRFTPAVVDFGRQKEWRWLIAIAFYFGGLGAGAFLVSLYFEFTVGMIVGYLVVAILKGGAHLSYLGHPLRVWRVFITCPTSWISRGLFFVVGFLLFGLLYLTAHFDLPLVSLWQKGTWLGEAVKVLTILFALAVMTYSGFAMAYSPAIPFWNTSLLPLLFLIYSFLGGTSLILFISHRAVIPTLEVRALERLEIGLMFLVIFALFTYLLTMLSSVSGAKESAKILLIGKYAPAFLGGVAFVGLILPLIIGCHLYFGSPSEEGANIGLAAAGFMEFVGGFVFRISLLLTGTYRPLI